MTPIGFSVNDGVTTFHYDDEEMEEFILVGQRDGNNGVILMRREGNLLIYVGYGTIEFPRTTWTTITLVHNPRFDGPMPTDEERLIPPKPMFEDVRAVILDFKQNAGEPQFFDPWRNTGA